jgi:hypothetical protein
MRPPDPTQGQPQFPIAAAEDLASTLVQLAAKLEQAIGARARAGTSWPEFQGTVASEYREDLQSHVGAVHDVIEQFRRTAGALRDAARDPALRTPPWVSAPPAPSPLQVSP